MARSIFFTKHPKGILIGLLLLSTILVFTRFRLLSLLIDLGVVAAVLTQARRDFVRYYIWSYLIFFSCTIVLYQIGWMTHIKFGFAEVVLFLTAAIWVVIVFSERLGLPKLSSRTRSWPGALAALVVCLFVCLPVLVHPGPVSVLRYAAKTSDDINHLAMIEADRQTEGYIYSNNADASKLLVSAFIGYPQGWHVNGALLESVIINASGKSGLSERLFSFLIYKVAWLFITTFLVFELMITVFRVMSRKDGLKFELFFAGLTAILSILLLVQAFGYGFQNFVADIGLVCAACVLAIRSFSARGLFKQLYVVCLALLTVAATSVWVLPGAIVGLITVYVVASGIKLQWSAYRLWAWLVLAISLLLCLSQLYVMLSTQIQGGVSGLNSGGATPPIRIGGVVLVFIIACALAAKTSSAWRARLLWLLGIVTAGFLLMVAYQQLSFGQQRYYIIKLGIMVAVVSTSILAAVLLSTMIKKASPHNLLLGLLILTIILPIFLGLDLKKSAYPLKDGTPIQPATAKSILDLPDEDWRTVVLTSNKEETYLATKLLSDSRPFTDPQRQVLLEKLVRDIGR